MKIIVISDLHNRVYWVEDALSSSLLQPYDRVVFLGDYFDDFGDTPNDARKSAKWLKQSLKMPNRIHLYGTHDLWYRSPFNPYIAASGNTEEKYYAIQDILDGNDWDQIILYHYEQDYIMTHAGIHPYLISEYVYKNRNIFGKYISNKNLQLGTQDIVNMIIKPATDNALERISKGLADEWLGAGFARGGTQPVGGITWLDWNNEFKPIPYLNQIVGHTEHKYPQEKITRGSKNYDLDTRSHHIGIIEDSVFTWIENPYL